jgi:DNA-binding response OmpR family regulator
MLVEDNVDDEFLAMRTLRKAGIAEISVARDGQEALNLLLTSGRPLPEMLILDLRLPRVDGLKLFAELRSHERTMALPVLVLTSSDDPRDRETCLTLGAMAFFTKPLELGGLLQLLS